MTGSIGEILYGRSHRVPPVYSKVGTSGSVTFYISRKVYLLTVKDELVLYMDKPKEGRVRIPVDTPSCSSDSEEDYSMRDKFDSMSKLFHPFM
jgi:hypothetical protein